MKAILDAELVREAIDLALPSVRKIVAAHTWGPKGVVIAVRSTYLTDPVIHIMEELGDEESWGMLWEGKNFREIALQKLSTALQGGTSSRNVVVNHPWLLVAGNSLYTGAVAEDTGLAVAASGAYGETDETVAWIVFNIIVLLCQRRVAQLQEKEINHL